MIEALGISLTEILFAVVNFLILVGVLTKFLYKPFLGNVEKRKQTIQAAFDNAEAINKRADEKMDSYNKRIANVEQEARDIIKESKLKADRQAAQIIADANEQAARIIKQAEVEIERERSKAVADIKGEIAALVVMAAERIIEKELDAEGQTQIVDNILKEAGASGWQN